MGEQAKVAAKSVYEILDYKSSIEKQPKNNTTKKPEVSKGDIAFTNVSFGYTQKPNGLILNNLSFKLNAGQTLAFIGSSGCGKSTIMQLIQRFYDPLEGQISIDGHNLKDLDIDYVRDQMAFVSQEPILFDMNIRDNIRMGKLDATDKEIEQAAKQADAHTFIVDLEDQYDTNVGENGSQLSGGQKQKICIARALVRNPKILLLDEATSALDLTSEDKILRALDAAKFGRTTLIIAHRLHTIKNADLIVGLQNGAICEIGSHLELMEKKGLYYALSMQHMKNAAELDQENISRNVTPIENLTEDLIPAENEATDSIHMEKIAEVQAEFLQISGSKRVLQLLKFVWIFHSADAMLIACGFVVQLIAGSTLVVASFVTMELINMFGIFDPALQRDQSYVYGGINVGIAIVSLISNALSSYFFSLASAKLTKRIRMQMFESVMRQEIGWHDLDDNQASNLSIKLADTAQLCQGLTTDSLNVYTRVLSSFSVALIASLIFNWQLALIVFMFAIAHFLSSIFYASNKQIFDSANDEIHARMGEKLMMECTSNIRTIKSLNKEQYFIDKFNRFFSMSVENRIKSGFITSIAYALRNSIIFFMMLANFNYGTTFVKAGTLTVTNLSRIYLSMIIMTDSLFRYFSLVPDVKKALDATETALRIIKRTPKIDSMSETGLRLPTTTDGTIEFHDVYFRYPTRKNLVLNGLNLKIEANKMTALVGSSGCGKSTIIQILLRFYDVDRGTVTFGGVDIRDLNVIWLRSNMGFVSQEPGLFNMNIKRNIELGNSSPDGVSRST
jgi:ATP-binding cassette subfamily B (MDR/TAP) protein 1